MFSAKGSDRREVESRAALGAIRALKCWPPNFNPTQLSGAPGRAWVPTLDQIADALAGPRGSSWPTPHPGLPAATQGPAVGSAGQGPSRPVAGSASQGVTRPVAGSAGQGLSKPVVGSAGQGPSRPVAGSSGQGPSRPVAGSAGQAHASYGQALPGRGLERPAQALTQAGAQVVRRPSRWEVLRGARERAGVFDPDPFGYVSKGGKGAKKKLAALFGSRITCEEILNK